MRNIIIYLFCTMSYFLNYGQSTYEVQLTPISIPQLGGIQSYAVGTHMGEWLILGGRLDGLHMKQPFAAFSADGNNENAIVVNPQTKEVWSQSVTHLPGTLKEQLSSTNMQFCQNEGQLILTGGYAYSPTQDDHITYPFLTAVDISSVIESVKKGELSSEGFQQIENASFQVAGGRLAMIEDVYFLVGGHKFMGRYNPMGPEHGPGFEQEYTNEVRKFKLNNNEGLEVEFLNPIHDEMHLHKRDYNLVPTILDGEYGLTAYSGVFQNEVDLPWLYPVQITEGSYRAIEDFSQYFNHYHCATLPIFNEEDGEMHTLFFGGIAQFYMDGDILVQDNDVPFVNTITDVSLTQSGEYEETILNTSMPGYLGAGSEFTFASESNNYQKGILSGDSVGDEYVDVGYIYGGIRSTLPNIFWINTGTESEATNTIYKVSLRKRNTSSATEQAAVKEKILFYPNPTQHFVKMSIDLEHPVDIQVDITDSKGLQIHSQQILKSTVQAGKNLIVLDDVKIGYGAFLYRVTYDNKTITRKVIWAE